MMRRAIAVAVGVVLFASTLAFGADGGSARNHEDPYERVNRVTFELNNRVLRYSVRPIAKGYRWLIPRPLRDGFRNFLENLNSPLLFGNQLLQGDPKAAVRTLERLVVNSTLGLAGTIDVAERFGIPGRNTDLGMTLGRWGVGEGPYVVMPLLGPTIPRDTLAAFAQGAADPLNLWVKGTDFAFYAFLVRFVFGNIDLYSRHMDELDALEESSIDFYAAFRNLYQQKRRADIRKIIMGDAVAPVGVDYNLEFDDGDSETAEEGAREAPVSP